MRVINSLFIVYRLYVKVQEDCLGMRFQFQLKYRRTRTHTHTYKCLHKNEHIHIRIMHIHTLYHIRKKTQPFYGCRMYVCVLYTHPAGMKKFPQNTIIYHPRTIHFMFCSVLFCWTYFFFVVSFRFWFFTVRCSCSCSFSHSLPPFKMSE